ncbi:magnesium/cobalt transporter CorA [Marinigracilibium pacificum]|uniref:Magnesium transport protein CorA n=1 Tax=Marinigracilibium pacificum TaxID=2729599 RepID=A0A848J3Q4_9BACT|nr:magnesium/cobalt transporter CorA [Marinigracilibium pacificum]NMM48989.1 magnesium/cobalt transporter CorA [Marinigracilibium pacificum]
MLSPFRFKHSPQKPGMQPGSLVYTGHNVDQKTDIQLIRYNSDWYDENTSFFDLEQFKSQMNDDHISWLNFHGLNEVEHIKKLGDQLSISNMIMEDMLDTRQRPKLEEMEDYLFFTLKSITNAREDEDEMNIEQISFIVGKNYVVSLQEKKADIFEELRKRIRNNSGVVRSKGSDYLLFSQLDAIIDQYYYVLDQIIEKIEKLEEDVMENYNRRILIDIETQRKKLNNLMRVINPLKDAAFSLEIRQKYIQKKNMKYFHDLKDNVQNIIDQIDFNRNIIDGLSNLYFSNLSQNQNDIFRVLTVISSIFIPITFIAGVFGMNFNNMFGLDSPAGFEITMGAMLFIVIAMLFYFKRKGWL